MEGLVFLMIQLLSFGMAVLGEHERTGCHMASNVNVESCSDLNNRSVITEMEVTSVLPVDSSCTVSLDVFQKQLICLSNGRITEVEIKGREKRFGEMAGLGLAVGAPFGPIGGAIGAGVGLVADIVCIFLCKSRKSSGPPPNTPPKLTCPDMARRVFMADKHETTAIVSWGDPKVTDKEDRSIKVKISPLSYKSGRRYEEGFHIVKFRAQDSGGFSDTCSISFEVKVRRCFPPQRPDNGYLEYTTLVFGSTYTVACKDGYVLDDADKAPVECVSMGNTARWSRSVTDCIPKACQTTPTVSNGRIVCRQVKPVFGSWCQIVCDEGYRVRGLFFVGCDENGNWGTIGSCKDVTPPRFETGSCPNDIRVNIDSANNTAFVTWDLPTGTDNSGEQPFIEEVHGNKPKTIFKAGFNTIRYRIRDASGNIGDSCVFSIQVSTISCQPPDLNVAGAEHMLYDCPKLYRLGAECSLSCRSGYPLGGVTKIVCVNDDGSDPPLLQWRWDKNGLAPFCKVSECHDLATPNNGALACSLWDHGNMCQLQCQKGFDIPRTTIDGMYVCGKSDGKWRPDENIPDCNPATNAHTMHLPSDAYYYTDKCNSSAANLHQIGENFVQALNSSKYFESCRGVPECKAEFVNITCGQITSRRKRDVDLVYKRAASRLAYTLTFEFTLPFMEDSRPINDIFTEKENILYAMVDVVQKEMDTGHFDLHLPGIHLESDSFSPGNAGFKCPKGFLPKRDKASCSGCPTGRFYDEIKDDCVYCPVGTYQDEPNQLGCKKCPYNTNTTTTGTINQTQCLEYCQPGHSSPTGMQPCIECPSTSYQPKEGSTTCLKCDSGLRTLTEGAKQSSSCQVYDIQTSNGRPVSFIVQTTYTSISLTSWLQIRKGNRNSLVRIQSADGNMFIEIFNERNINVVMNGKPMDTRIKLQMLEWFHLGLVVNTTHIQLFVNGNKVLSDSTVTLGRTNILQAGDRIGINADVLVSSFYVSGSPLHATRMEDLSRTCIMNETVSIYNIDSLADSSNASIIVPSLCDAVDECNPLPCGNHTDECVNKKDDFICICKDGYSGKTCEIKPNFCDNNDCKNGGTCLDGAVDYTCICEPGYHGELCDKKAVDGNWSEWSEWSTCSATCHGGLSQRERRCDNPTPDSDGKNCTGAAYETQICNPEPCPECSTLRRTYGLVITCNDTDELKRCTVGCRAGLFFAKPPLPYYECGRLTEYKWNHQNEDNPDGKLPSCSDIKPPTNLAVTMDGHYENVLCSKTNVDNAVKSLESKLQTLDCVKSGLCKAEVVGQRCGSRKWRSDDHSMTLTVGLKTDVKGNATELRIKELLANQTAPSSQLRMLMTQIMEMERTAQDIFNNSMNFFQVTINGTQHTIANGSSGLTVEPSVRCPSGSIQLDAFCAECPVGSYSDGIDVFLCPKGQFQDQPGQSTCNMCPNGQTTVGVGSIYISECIDNTIPHGGRPSKTANEGTSSSTAIVAVVVSLSIVVVVVIGIVFLYRYIKRRMKDRANNPDVFDLKPPPYSERGAMDIQSRPVFSPSRAGDSGTVVERRPLVPRVPGSNPR